MFIVTFSGSCSNNLSKLLFSIKKYDIRLANNIMTNPGYYFKKIFEKLNYNYLQNYDSEINQIQEILPNITIDDRIFAKLAIKFLGYQRTI